MILSGLNPGQFCRKSLGYQMSHSVKSAERKISPFPSVVTGQKDAGKPAIKIALPPRFPGMSDTVEIGRQRQNTSVAPHGITIPDPAPPVFEESLSFLQERVSKMVGKVAVSSHDKGTSHHK